MTYATPRAAVAAAVVLVLLAAPAAPATSLRVYHIGNSVTDTLRYNGVNAQATQMGHSYTFGKHVAPGQRLVTTWNTTPTSPGQFSANGFGLYHQALRDFTWDAVTLQPFDSILGGSEGDLQIIKNFINYTTPKSPNAQFFVYSRWPRMRDNGSGTLTLNYEQQWLTPYTYTGTSTSHSSNETRGFFETLTQRLNDDLPGLNKKVRMVPVGDVLLEVDRRMRAGQVPGYSSINQLYTDHIHFGDPGSYIVGMTFFATLYRDNPMNTPKPVNWANITAAQVAQFQSAVWSVVSGHPYSGVIPGDFTRDGKTDIADFSILASRFNTTVTGLSQGDANGDLRADITDFSILAASFNQGASTATVSGAVPEPTSFVFLAAAAALTRRRGRPVSSST